MGVRWVYVRVKYLPPDAALWRVQEPSEPSHAAFSPGDAERLETNDPNKLAAWFNNAFNG